MSSCSVLQTNKSLLNSTKIRLLIQSYLVRQLRHRWLWHHRIWIVRASSLVGGSRRKTTQRPRSRKSIVTSHFRGHQEVTLLSKTFPKQLLLKPTTTRISFNQPSWPHRNELCFPNLWCCNRKMESSWMSEVWLVIFASGFQTTTGWYRAPRSTNSDGISLWSSASSLAASKFRWIYLFNPSLLARLLSRILRSSLMWSSPSTSWFASARLSSIIWEKRCTIQNW